MKYRLFLVSLLSGGLLVSCQSHKTGGDEDLLADNGGYSDGGFYGDSSHPAPPGYPRDGQDFTTSGGVPFGHNDPVDHVEPVVAEVEPAPPPAPRPAPAPLVASRPAASDPYETAYADNGSYGSDHGAERAVVTPYVERATPVATTTAAGSSKPGKTTAKSTSNKVAAGGSTKKKSPAVASSGGTSKSATKVSGKKTGTTVKTVYTPPTKGKSAAKKKATVVRVHDVKRGDSLSKLASRYGVTVAHLKKRNKLTSDTIVLGKRLTID